MAAQKPRVHTLLHLYVGGLERMHSTEHGDGQHEVVKMVTLVFMYEQHSPVAMQFGESYREGCGR